MDVARVVSREEWLVAHRDLLHGTMRRLGVAAPGCQDNGVLRHHDRCGS